MSTREPAFVGVDVTGDTGHNDEFYLRLYIGHKSRRFGHEFMVRESCQLLCLCTLVFCCCDGITGWSLQYTKLFSSFQEFEVCPSGKLRYANNSNYKDENIIRREVCLGPAVVAELKRIILTSEITTVDDESWGEPPTQRRQELEIKIGNEHIAFTCGEIMSLADIKDSNDPKGLTILYYLTQDLKCFIMSLINLHFKIKPIPT